jgi:hypothetical protein
MMDQTTTSAFHPKALIILDPTAGLLAFHIAGGLPIRQVADSGKYDCQQQNVDYSCGDSSGILFSTNHRYSLLIF